VDRAAYLVREPERGDIIVCYYPDYTVSCVKRVIGLPGDYILIEDGKVYINGNVVDESTYWDQEIVMGMAGRVVKEGHVFVIGDNRNNSLDSRSQDIGDIPYNKIEGKAVSIIWPLSNLRMIKHIDYPEYLWDPNDPDAVLISDWEREEELTQDAQDEAGEEETVSGFLPGAMPEEPK
jgi:signal peptidase I